MKSPSLPIFAFAVFLFAVCGNAIAEDAAGKMPESFAKNLAAAKKGDVTAQAEVGYYYAYADGVQRDIKEALKWLNKAAAKGNVKAESTLGALYRDGVNHPATVWELKRDPKQAEKWFRKAAAKGDAAAMNYMSSFAKDEKEMLSLLEQAAEKDDLGAMTTLGELYAGGSFTKFKVTPNPEKALHWRTKAAYFYGDGTLLTPEDIDSQYSLAYAYLKGDGVAQDYKKAAELFKRVVSHNAFVDMYNGGDYEEQAQDAYLQLGLIYRQGLGVKKDDRAAARWFGRAARLGSPEGWYNLGQSYENGDGVPKDRLQAYLAYSRLACDTPGCQFGDTFWFPRDEKTDPTPLAKKAMDRLTAKMGKAELEEARRVSQEEQDLSFQIANDAMVSAGAGVYAATAVDEKKK